MIAKFTIGSVVQFGKEKWEVLMYIKDKGFWEVVFRLVNSKKRMTIPCSKLEVTI